MHQQPLNDEEFDQMRAMMHQHPELSRTELRIWALVHRGLTSRQIADLLGCSLRNIENHRYRIGKKRRVTEPVTQNQFQQENQIR